MKKIAIKLAKEHHTTRALRIYRGTDQFGKRVQIAAVIFDSEGRAGMFPTLGFVAGRRSKWVNVPTLLFRDALKGPIRMAIYTAQSRLIAAIVR